MATEIKVIQVQVRGLDEAVKEFSDMNNVLKDQMAVLKALKKEKDKDTEAISRQTVEIIKQKAEIQVLGKEIKDEIVNRKKLAKTIDEQTDARLKAIDKEAKLAMRQQVQNAQAQAVIEKNSQAETLAAQKAEQQAAKKVGYINELRIEVNKLEQQYYALSKAELQGTQGAKVLSDLTTKRAELSKLNQAYGNYKDNVGNYSSATKMLGINLGQVMKEMPNFAISARIGIMSLTNNLPMLAESIKAVRAEQQAMIAAGQKAPSMFSLISKSIFGLTGFMSIAMVIMQIYGADIIKWVGSLFKATKATDVLKESHDNFIKSLKEGGGEYAKAVSDLEEMVAVMAAVEKGFIKKTDAVEEYNEKFGETIGEIKTYDQLEANMIKLVPKYVEAMAIKQEANLKLAEAVKLQGEIRALEEEQTITFWQKFGSTVITTFKDILTLKTDIFSMPSQLMQNAKLAEANILKDKSLDAKKKKEELDVLIKEYRIKFAEFSATGFSGVGDNKDKKAKAKETFDFEQKLREANAQAVEESMARELEKARANIKTKQDDLDEAYKKKLVTEKEYGELSNAYKEQLNREEGTIIDKYRETNLKKYQSYLDAQNKLAEDQIKDFWSFVKTTDDKVLKLYQGEVDSAANRYDLLKLKGIEDLESHKKLLEAKRQLEVEQAKETKADVNAINNYYAQLAINLDKEAFNAKLDMAAQVTSGLAELFGKETEAGKFAAATTVGIQGAQSAFKVGTLTAEYIASGNIPMAILSGAQTAVIIANTIKSIADIYAINTDIPNQNTSSTTSQVTEKYHTGGDVGSKADSNLKSNEVTATLLRGERILSNQQSSVFNSILGNIKMLGGSENITKSVGINADAQMQVMEIAFTRALARQKAPILDYSQFTTFVNKQVKFEQNTRI